MTNASATMTASDIAAYFGSLGDPLLKEPLEDEYGVVWAKLTGFPFWPARVASLTEYRQMLKHRRNEKEICVFFFGSFNYGWVQPKFILPFSGTPPKGGKKTKYIEAGIKAVYTWKESEAQKGGVSESFWERLERDKVALAETINCVACGRADSLETMLLCDGDSCTREYHMGCLSPPLTRVPDGVWFCPVCSRPSPVSDAAMPSLKRKRDVAVLKSTIEKVPEVSSTNGLPEEAPDNSEEKCLICDSRGELIVCEFPQCTKVYHKQCLLGYQIHEDPWYCPRHRCAITSTAEVINGTNASRQRNGDRNDCSQQTSRTPRKGDGSAKNEILWKCYSCPVAIAESVFPKVAVLKNVDRRNRGFSRKDRSFVCPICAHPPARVGLAKILEQVWTAAAGNHLSLPFLCPLLPGVACNSSECAIDLTRIFSKIRKLRYINRNEFLDDMRALRDQAWLIVGNRSKPLQEAAETMFLIAEEQLKRFNLELDNLEPECHGSDAEDAPYLPQGWVVKWRQECMPDQYLSDISVDPRSVDEWDRYVLSVPVYPRVGHEQMASRKEREIAASTAASPARYPAEYAKLNEKESKEAAQFLALLAAQRKEAEGSGDYVRAIEKFTSPSFQEIEQMFERQSAMIRKALEANAALKRAWKLSREEFLGPAQGAGHVVTLGEGRIAMELKLANKNLHCRLGKKEAEVSKLDEEKNALNQELKHALHRLGEAEKRISELKKQGDISAMHNRPSNDNVRSTLGTDRDKSDSAGTDTPARVTRGVKLMNKPSLNEFDTITG